MGWFGSDKRSYGSTRGARFADKRKARNRAANKVAKKVRKRARG